MIAVLKRILTVFILITLMSLMAFAVSYGDDSTATAVSKESIFCQCRQGLAIGVFFNDKEEAPYLFSVKRIICDDTGCTIFDWFETNMHPSLSHLPAEIQKRWNQEKGSGLYFYEVRRFSEPAGKCKMMALYFPKRK
ncbi:MAG: hypothetical protein U9M90_03830 [Patescibacteria group bacterium]|nr:hypothetical protein [Patescibacteria group bacterium]